ncbi:molybdopterin-dependent oxidoreductase [Cupriavidus sp. 30B13]|uniref:molybdopterin-dependent oxidoreductase n=1 Tax=Cupriavidus sp. 30B13 TaxID=3384241 RepID=UPI003B8FF6D9
MRKPPGPLHALLCAAFVPLLLSACGAAGGAGPATPAGHALQVAGTLDRPANLTLSQLQALPAATQTVTFASGSGTQTHAYVGTPLWGLLDGMGIQADPAAHNDVLARYVLATGADGYRVVFSLGELRPDFGNRASLVAYGEMVNGAAAPLAASGPLRATAPGDGKGGRYVSGLLRLDVRASGSTAAASGGGPSARIAVSGAVRQPRSFDLAALKALPAVTRTVGANTYTGVSLWDLLNATGGLATGTAKNDVLAMYVVATGSDGYKALVALGEIAPGFGNQPDLIAYEMNGAPLGPNGFARLVIPGDGKPGRHVSRLVSLEVFAAPAAP